MADFLRDRQKVADVAVGIAAAMHQVAAAQTVHDILQIRDDPVQYIGRRTDAVCQAAQLVVRFVINAQIQITLGHFFRRMGNLRDRCHDTVGQLFLAVLYCKEQQNHENDRNRTESNRNTKRKCVGTFRVVMRRILHGKQILPE